MRLLDRYLTLKQMRIIFLGHFMGRLSYGCPVWCNGTSTLQKQNLKDMSILSKSELRDYKRYLNRDLLA